MTALTLSDYAILYTATAAGTNSGARFLMSRPDAEAWCSSDRSRARNGQWAFFFTTVENFLRRDEGYGKRLAPLDIRRSVDDGRSDADIADLGLTKVPLDAVAGVLEPLGVEVLR